MDIYIHSYVLEPSTLNALSGALRHYYLGGTGTMYGIISAYYRLRVKSILLVNLDVAILLS